MWYSYFTSHVSSSGFHVHPYYYFRPLVDSIYDFTCGYDTPTVAAIIGIPGVSPVAAVAPVATVIVVPATVTAAPVITVPSVTTITAVAAITAVTAIATVTAAPGKQFNIPVLFQPRLQEWNNQIWIAISKKHVFKKGSPQ